MMRIGCFLLLTTCFFVLGACGDGGEDGKAPRARAFPVQVETIAGEKMDYFVSAVGSVEAFESVQVTARVRGVIEDINFREGQTVTPSDVLASIDEKRYEQAFNAAEAAEQRAKAELDEAVRGYNRRMGIVDGEPIPDKPPGIFTKEEVEAWKTKVAVATANYNERKAELETAQLNKDDSKPKAPIAGTIQSRLVQTGQWVEPGTVIARLLRRDPMLIRFAVTESQAAQLKHGQIANFSATGQRREYRATITHVAASADSASRMVQAVGEVFKEDAADLTPGTFIRVNVPVGSRSDAPTVPETAIRPSEKGFLVYVVVNEKAEQRVIELGLRTPNGRIEVRAGLEPGEVVVVRGAEALRPGVTVRVVSPEAEGPATAPEVAN
jgi:multidrug efflux system membrane fusion protein